MTVVDERLLDAPMCAVECLGCAATVHVRKASWQQTTLQWNQSAQGACLERRTTVAAPGPNGATFPGCRALSASIRAAAASGHLPVVAERSEG
jgi:hypothetical protein